MRRIFKNLRKSALPMGISIPLRTHLRVNSKTNNLMKKTIFTLIFIGIVFCGYTQNEAKPNELTSPIMLDFLKIYQEKNGIQKIEKAIPFNSEPSKKGIQEDKNVKFEIENINNMIIVKPNLVEIMRMPVVRSDESTHHTMKIINSDTNKVQPIR